MTRPADINGRAIAPLDVLYSVRVNLQLQCPVDGLTLRGALVAHADAPPRARQFTARLSRGATPNCTAQLRRLCSRTHAVRALAHRQLATRHPAPPPMQCCLGGRLAGVHPVRASLAEAVTRLVAADAHQQGWRGRYCANSSGSSSRPHRPLRPSPVPPSTKWPRRVSEPIRASRSRSRILPNGELPHATSMTASPANQQNCQMHSNCSTTGQSLRIQLPICATGAEIRWSGPIECPLLWEFVFSSRPCVYTTTSDTNALVWHNECSPRAPVPSTNCNWTLVPAASPLRVRILPSLIGQHPLYLNRRLLERPFSRFADASHLLRIL